MKHLEKIAKKLLSPASDLVDGSIIFEDFFDSSAIAQPKEFGTPKKFPVLADAPATAAGFTNKGVTMTLSFGAAAGTKANGSETSAFHGHVEVGNAVRAKKGQGDFGSVGVIWLHQHPTHAETGPIGLEKARLGRITASETRRRGDADLQFSPKRREWWSP